MPARYVTALPQTCVAHVLTEDGTTTVCNFMPLRFTPRDKLPTGMRLCRNCRTVLARQAKWATRRARVLARRDAAIVAMLIDGLKDEAVARRLGIERRTVTRYIGDAMRRAGVESRFQWGYMLGLKARKQ